MGPSILPNEYPIPSTQPPLKVYAVSATRSFTCYDEQECNDAVTAGQNDGFGSNWDFKYLIKYAESFYVSELKPSTHSNPLQAALVYFLFPPSTDPSLTQIVLSPDSNSADIPTCGWKTLPCQTIHQGYSQILGSSLNQIQLQGSSHKSEEESTLFEGEDISLSFLPYAKSVVKNVTGLKSSEPIFVVSQLNLTFSDVYFEFSEQNAIILSSYLFFVKSGILSLYRTAFCPSGAYDGQIFVASPLISVSSEGNAVLGMYAQRIVMKTKDGSSLNGSIVYAEVGSENYVQFDNCNYINCDNYVGYGGAVYIRGDSFETSLSFSSLSFDQCSHLFTVAYRIHLLQMA